MMSVEFDFARHAKSCEVLMQMLLHKLLLLQRSWLLLLRSIQASSEADFAGAHAFEIESQLPPPPAAAASAKEEAAAAKELATLVAKKHGGHGGGCDGRGARGGSGGRGGCGRRGRRGRRGTPAHLCWGRGADAQKKALLVERL